MGRNPKLKTKKNTNPSFFKVMIGDFTNTLRIPPAFVNRYKGIISPGKFQLRRKGPNTTTTGNKSWIVNVKKIEKDLVFQEGWRGFAQDNSLAIGDFLVFTCVWKHEKSRLLVQVQVFGTTGCEKGISLLPSVEHQEKTRLQNVGCGKKASGVERRKPGIEVVLPWSTTKQTNLHGNSRKSITKLQGQCSVSKNFEQSNLEGAVYEEQETDEDSVEVLGTSAWKNIGSVTKETRDQSAVDRTTKQRTGRHSTNYSVQPLRQLSQKQISKKKKPKSLRSESFGKKLENDLVPFDSDSLRSESMDTSHTCSSHRNNEDDAGGPTENGNLEVSLPSGKGRLDSFTEDMGIKSKILHTPVFARKKHPPTSKQTHKALQVAQNFKSTNPFFITVLRPSYMRKGFINIPYKFVERYMIKRCSSKQTRTAKIWGPDARLWYVQATLTHNNSYLCHGWRAFLLGNDLREGDVCIFEVIKKGKYIEMKVSCVRAPKDV